VSKYPQGLVLLRIRQLHDDQQIAMQSPTTVKGTQNGCPNHINQTSRHKRSNRQGGTLNVNPVDKVAVERGSGGPRTVHVVRTSELRKVSIGSNIIKDPPGNKKRKKQSDQDDSELSKLPRTEKKEVELDPEALLVPCSHEICSNQEEEHKHSKDCILTVCGRIGHNSAAEEAWVKVCFAGATNAAHPLAPVDRSKSAPTALSHTTSNRTQFCSK